MNVQPHTSPAPPRRARRPRPFTVGEVLHQVRSCLEDQFLPVLVVGEVADRRQPRSGHLYLTLRDATARLRVVVFARVLERMGLAGLEDGDEVLVWGRITAYAPSGDVQLVADRIEPRGEGLNRAARERLRRRLQGEGLFAPERKRALPFLPRSIGVVTSPTGAALRDVRTTIDRRFPTVRLVLAPARVNGVQAAPEVARALAELDRRGGVDVILLVRGGGSQEDLAAFDEEVLVRAVAACRTPVIVGVGHETDVSLCDLAADRRAPTPTGAAELAVPVRSELEAELDRRQARLAAAARGRLRAARRRLDLAARAHGLQAPRLRVDAHAARLAEAARRLERADPRARAARWREQLAEAERRLRLAEGELVARRRRDLDEAARRLSRADPRGALAVRTAAVEERAVRLERAMAGVLRRAEERLAAGAGRLESLSPLRVLARGYSLTTSPAGEVLRDAAELEPGARVRTRLARGGFLAEVVSVEPPAPEGAPEA